MTDEYVSYVPSGNGRFVRYSHAPPSSSSSNRFFEFGRSLYNIFRALFQLLNLLHSVITAFNNLLASLPSFIRYIIHALLAICFPFYTIYQGYMALINRIHQITYPIYRTITFITRLFTIFVQLPVRIITFLINETRNLLKNLFILLIFVSIILALLVIFLDEDQLIYIKSHIHNATDFILKKSSMI